MSPEPFDRLRTAPVEGRTQPLRAGRSLAPDPEKGEEECAAGSDRQQHQSDGVAARCFVVSGAQDERKEEASEPATCANDAGNGADPLGRANSATQAKTPPVPSPRKRAIRANAVPAGISGGSRSAMISDITAAPPRERTRCAGRLSARMPPIGRAITAAMAKPAVLVPAPSSRRRRRSSDMSVGRSRRPRSHRRRRRRGRTSAR